MAVAVRPNGPVATGPRGQGRQRWAWGRRRWDPPLLWVTSSSPPHWGPRQSRMPDGMRKSTRGLELTQPPPGGACCVPRDKCGYAASQRDAFPCFPSRGVRDLSMKSFLAPTRPRWRDPGCGDLELRGAFVVSESPFAASGRTRKTARHHPSPLIAPAGTGSTCPSPVSFVCS
jgi:hypothetical protein